MDDSPQLPGDTNVLIVGAGPVGLTLATALAANGVPAVVIDKQAEGANTSRACVVHSRTLEVLREMEVSQQLISRGLIVPRFTVRDRDRVLLTIDFDQLPTEYPYTLMVPQNITEQVLLERLHAVGGRVYRPYELAGPAQDRDGVAATMADGSTVRASYAVGPDGMHSTLTRADRQLAAALLRGSGDHTRQLAVAVRRLSSVRGPGSGRITDHEGGHRGVAGIRP